jgi:hypothetical protein
MRPLVSAIPDAFRRWFAEARCRVEIPLIPWRITANSVELLVRTIDPGLRVLVRPDGLDMIVDHERTAWDVLLSVDVEPITMARGFKCAHCEPSERRLFSSLDELWVDHLFAPLEDFMKRLAEHDFVALYAMGGSNWARLGKGNAPTDARAVIRVKAAHAKA